jgi:hypothetical protein
LRIISLTLQPGEDVLVGRRLQEILNGARKSAASLTSAKIDLGS